MKNKFPKSSELPRLPEIEVVEIGYILKEQSTVDLLYQEERYG